MWTDTWWNPPSLGKKIQYDEQGEPIQSDFVAFQNRIDLFGRSQHAGGVLVVEECPSEDHMALVTKIMKYSGYVEIRPGRIFVERTQPGGYRFR